MDTATYQDRDRTCRSNRDNKELLHVANMKGWDDMYKVVAVDKSGRDYAKEFSSESEAQKYYSGLTEYWMYKYIKRVMDGCSYTIACSQ